MQMNSEDLERYGVTHALHRRKILAAVERLCDADMEDHLDIDELDDFLTMVDEDRVRLIARLKVAFDQHDEDKDGILHQFELREVR
jgi:hypothetical protein